MMAVDTNRLDHALAALRGVAPDELVDALAAAVDTERGDWLEELSTMGEAATEYLDACAQGLAALRSVRLGRVVRARMALVAGSASAAG